MRNMTNHNRGSAIAAKWLSKHFRCSPVITEVQAINGENPDAIGWVPRGPSIVVDWKESHADAVRHLEKRPVVHPVRGVGEYRWIASRPNIVDCCLIPGWPIWLGLVWIGDDGQIEQVRHAGRHGSLDQRAEMELLRSYAAKAGYQQQGAVQRQTWLDKAAKLLEVHGPMKSVRIAAELGLSKNAYGTARELDKDGRFQQNPLTREYELKR